jgi:hypothetical protein
MKKIISIIIIFTFSFLSQQLHALEIEKLADDDWLLVKSTNFTIITDLDAEKGTSLARDLESYRHFSIEMMGLKLLNVAKPLTVLAISSSSSFKRLELPENWAGVFNLDAEGYAAIANVSNYRNNLKTQTFARQVLFHEYNHFLIRFSERTINFPMWYDEGMAEYMGTFKYDGQKIYLGDPSAVMGRADDLFSASGNMLLDVEKLLKTRSLPMTSKKEKDKSEVSKFYAQAFFLIHYFNSSPEMRANLFKYIAYLNEGLSEDQAFKKAFNMTYEELGKSAKKYLGGGLRMRVISTEKGIQFPVFDIKTTSMTKPEFYSYMGYTLTLFDFFEHEDKSKLLKMASELSPNNSDFKAILLRSGFSSDPEKIQKELEAQTPQNVIFINYKADNLRYAANLQRQTGFANWQDTMKQARSLYRRAIKTDAFYALPYFGLGDVYNWLPNTEPLQEGAVGFDTASLYSRNFRQFSDLADINIRMDKGVDALDSIRNAIAFSEDKEKSSYSLTRENLEILLTATQDKPDVVDGELRYKDGSVYQGVQQNNKPHGAGKFIRPNGSYQEGTYEQGVIQGKGTLVTLGGYKYEGDFQKGIVRGKGKITYPKPTENTYEGDIFYAIPFGKGISTFENGKYEGDFWYSWPQGQGTYTSKDNKVKLQGNWYQWRYEWPEQDGVKFFGFTDDDEKRNGFGVCNFSDKHITDYCVYKNGVLQEKSTEVAVKK